MPEFIPDSESWFEPRAGGSPNDLPVPEVEFGTDPADLLQTDEGDDEAIDPIFTAHDTRDGTTEAIPLLYWEVMASHPIDPALSPPSDTTGGGDNFIEPPVDASLDAGPLQEPLESTGESGPAHFSLDVEQFASDKVGLAEMEAAAQTQKSLVETALATHSDFIDEVRFGAVTHKVVELEYDHPVDGTAKLYVSSSGNVIADFPPDGETATGHTYIDAGNAVLRRDTDIEMELQNQPLEGQVPTATLWDSHYAQARNAQSGHQQERELGLNDRPIGVREAQHIEGMVQHAVPRRVSLDELDSIFEQRLHSREPVMRDDAYKGARELTKVIDNLIQERAHPGQEAVEDIFVSESGQVTRLWAGTRADALGRPERFLRIQTATTVKVEDVPKRVPRGVSPEMVENYTTYDYATVDGLVRTLKYDTVTYPDGGGSKDFPCGAVYGDCLEPRRLRNYLYHLLPAPQANNSGDRA